MNLKETEKGFQAAVIELATLRGWLVYHTYDSRRSAKGFPDLCMVRGGTLIFAELKAKRGVLTSPQEEWILRLIGVKTRTGGEVKVFVWRPSDWNEIEETLK